MVVMSTFQRSISTSFKTLAENQVDLGKLGRYNKSNNLGTFNVLSVYVIYKLYVC